MLLQRISRFFSQRPYFQSVGDWLKFGRLQYFKDRGSPGLIQGCQISLIRIKSQVKPLAARPATTDSLMLREVFIDGGYDMLLMHREALGAIRTVVDIGGNAGYFTRFALSNFPGATVLAVEPDEGNMGVLRENIRLAGAEMRAQAVQVCATGRRRRVGLDRSGGQCTFRMTERPSGEGGVDGLTVPEILALGGLGGTVDLLKCDVEGTESEIFAECSSWIGRVRNLVIEIHAPYDAAGLSADLARNGADLRVLASEDPTSSTSVVLLSGTAR
jgi:FkbM family methyltransferase